MKIIETGIIIKTQRETPVRECVGFQAISHQLPTGKWVIDGYEVLRYCMRDDDMYPQHKAQLPCYHDGCCIWDGVNEPKPEPEEQVKDTLPTPVPHQLPLEIP